VGVCRFVEFKMWFVRVYTRYPYTNRPTAVVKKTHFGGICRRRASRPQVRRQERDNMRIFYEAHYNLIWRDGSRCGRTEQTTWRLQWRRWRSIWAFTHKPLGSSAVGEAWPRAVFIIHIIYFFFFVTILASHDDDDGRTD